MVLIEYDPSKTSYEVLVHYAYRNMDPFDGTGQFCNKGLGYAPAIFYATEEERLVVETVLETILLEKDWNPDDIEASILPRPVFWTAGVQDFYIRFPSQFGNFNNDCERPERLKQVWGEHEYDCFHDESHACFVTADNPFGDDEDDDWYNTTLGDDERHNNTTTKDDDAVVNSALIRITNADGVLVVAESNAKGAGPERTGKNGGNNGYVFLFIFVVGCVAAALVATWKGWVPKDSFWCPHRSPAVVMV